MNRKRRQVEKQGEESVDEVNDTMVEPGTYANTNDMEEDTSSSSLEGQEFYDVEEPVKPVEVEPGEIMLGMRRKKVGKRGYKPAKKAKKRS